MTFDIENLLRIVQARGTKADVESGDAALEEGALAYATDTEELGIYTDGAWVWIGAAGGGDATSIDGIDVDLTGIGDGDAITYDAYTDTLVPLTPAGAGDMLKATYDADEDDVVDEAAAVEGVDAAGNSKYYGTDGAGTPGFYDLPSGAEDTAAIHDDESGEIHAITEKETPVDDDELLIEDSEASYAKKRLKISNLPSSGGGFSSGDIHQVELYRGTLAEAGNFDVSSISQDYDHLRVILLIRSSVAAATDNCNFILNNDSTAANYFRERLSGTANSSSAGYDADNLLVYIAAGSAAAGDFSLVIIDIPWYTLTNHNKILDVSIATRVASATAYVSKEVIQWESTSAINRITVQPDGYATDKLVANSIMQIIGIKTVS